MPRGPSSRPKPERLVPPNGRSAPSPAGVFTLAMPTSNCSATLTARSSSVDQTAPPRPKSTTLASWPAPRRSPTPPPLARRPHGGQLDRLIVGADLVDDGDRAEQLLAVAPHVRGHASEHGRSEVRAVTVVERAADVQRRALRDRVLHLGEEVLRCLAGDHRAVGARGVIARL